MRKGFLEFESLSETLKMQACEVFFKNLRWKEGMFFSLSIKYPFREEILINERIDHLLLEGIVRLDHSVSRTDSVKQVK